MKQTKGESAHSQAWMDTPLTARPGEKMAEAYAKNDPDHLLDVPGIMLKSKETKNPTTHMSKYFGKLTDYSDEEVVVISNVGSVDHPCIWRGTSSEYRAMWMVD